MKPIFVFFIFFNLLLLFANLNEARSEPEDYWKSIMKDEPLPEPIKELLKNPFRTEQEKFVKNFDPKASVIIYHSSGGAHHKMEVVKPSSSQNDHKEDITLR